MFYTAEHPRFERGCFVSSYCSSLLAAITLRQIQHFVVVAHARSFTQAARVLSLTQPALTASIRQIEFLLGGSLFVRSTHWLSLTPAGEAALPLAERLLNQARATFDDMIGLISEHIHTVRISFIPSIANRLLPTLYRLRQTQPMLRFTLTDSPNNVLIKAVQDGTADIGVGVYEPDQDDGTLCYEQLFEDEIVAVVHRDDAFACRKSVLWRDLVDRELAVFIRGSVSGALQRIANSEQLHLTVTYQMTHAEPIYALVRNGLAVGIFPSLNTMHLHDPAFVVLRLEKPYVSRTISLISLAGEDRGQHIRGCREWIAQHI